jgi:hypothetical protein
LPTASLTRGDDDELNVPPNPRAALVWMIARRLSRFPFDQVIICGFGDCDSL